MEKLTDNEIIKVLECCKTTLSEIGACKECPLYQGEGHTCITTLSKNALDLINRLKVESAGYRNKAQTQKGELARLYKQNAEQKAEIEDLKKVIETMTNEQLQFGFENLQSKRNGGAMRNEIQKETCCGRSISNRQGNDYPYS